MRPATDAHRPQADSTPGIAPARAALAGPSDRWHAEHANFAALLDLLEQELAAFHDGGEPDYGLMLDILSYLRHFPDRFHHPREDVAVEFLLRHEPSLRLPVNRLLQEHRVIAAAGEELEQRLNQVVDGAVMARADVEAAAAVYLTYYRYHLASEDREILPRAERLLSAEEWRLVGEAAGSEPDPLFGDAGDTRYRQLRERLAERRAQAPGTGPRRNPG
jgi:hemerythrin-like domain-containing protein